MSRGSVQSYTDYECPLSVHYALNVRAFRRNSMTVSSATITLSSEAVVFASDVEATLYYSFDALESDGKRY